MQKFGNTIITDSGMQLLDSVNGGDDKIQYTKTVLAGDDFTQTTDDAIKVVKDLQSIKQTVPTTVASRINDTINLSASFTNTKVTEDYDFYCIGWYAKGSAVLTDERLFAISPSTVKQTMPKSQNGAATASITPKYASALSRNAQVIINPEPAGSVTKEYVDQQVQALIDEGIINGGSILSDSDDLNLLITTSYHLDKGSLPKNAPDGYSKYGQVIVYGNKDTTDSVTQLAYDDINHTQFFRSYDPTKNTWSAWDQITTKSQLDDVLPKDIARTGADNAFTGSNSFTKDPVNANGDTYGLAKDINTKVTDNGDNSIEINKQSITPVRDNKDGSINFNAKTMTPADDSKVVHSADTSNWQKQKITNDDGTALVSIGDSDDLSAKISSFNTGFFTLYYSAKCANNPSTKAGLGFIEMTYFDKVNGSDGNGIIFDEDNVAFVVTVLNSNVTYSRLASLSGANNFDTVPTVNNNPLLLASSLPSDLARTGQANTFTAAQTFSIAPVINDASTDKGDNQAATMADLKSLENSAWHQLDSSKVTGGAIINSLVLYKIDEPNKKIYLSFTVMRDLNSSLSDHPIYFDFSGIINKILSVSGTYTINTSDSDAEFAINLSDNKIMVNSSGSYFIGSYITASNSQVNVTQPTISYDKLLI